MSKDSIGVNNKIDESMDNVRRITLGKEDKKKFGSWLKFMIFFMKGIENYDLYLYNIFFSYSF